MASQRRETDTKGIKMNVFSWTFVLPALASLGLFIVVRPHGRGSQISAHALVLAVLVMLLVIWLYLLFAALI